ATRPPDRWEGQEVSTAESGTRPTALPVVPENIPHEIRASSQCVGWRYVEEVNAETGEVDWDKPPINIHTGGLASSTNARTWVDFATALAAYQRGDLDGIGYCLNRAPGDKVGIVGIDLDHCRAPETGEIEPWAWGIVQAISSYT